MINLSINEQKKIFGGLWEAVVYCDEVNEVTDAQVFKTRSEARDWVKRKYPNSRYKIYRL